MTAYEIYQMYVALKAHFTTNYNYFQYNGQIKVNYDAYERRRDKHFFVSLSKHKNPFNYLLANIISNKRFWIGDAVKNIETDKIYTEWMKRNESLSYVFKSELKKLLDEHTLRELLLAENKQTPILIRKYLGGKICPETFIILLDISGCICYWDSNLCDDIAWKEMKVSVQKYMPFIKYDKARFKEILLTANSQERV